MVYRKIHNVAQHDNVLTVQNVKVIESCVICTAKHLTQELSQNHATSTLS
jgi:hypothetical protein